jgi:hypothetical protein
VGTAVFPRRARDSVLAMTGEIQALREPLAEISDLAAQALLAWDERTQMPPRAGRCAPSRSRP